MTVFSGKTKIKKNKKRKLKKVNFCLTRAKKTAKVP